MYAYNDGNKPLIEGAHSELETVLFHEIRITYKRSKCKSAYVLKVLIVLFWRGMVVESLRQLTGVRSHDGLAHRINRRSEIDVLVPFKAMLPNSGPNLFQCSFSSALL